MINADPTLAEIDRELCKRRGGFAHFAKSCWLRGLIPRMPKGAKWTWVQQEICNHAEACWRGELPLNVFGLNMSPGGGKTTIVSVLFPAWIYSQHPDALIMGAGYDPSLQFVACDGMLEIMRSRWYVERWGDITGNGRSGQEFYTSRGGYRYMTSVQGAGTGRHCDLYIGDDLLKAQTARANQDKDAETARQLALANEFVQSAVVSRGRDENFRFVLNMQRLHEGDPAGFVMRAIPEATFLRLPYWFEPHARCVTAIGGDRRQVLDEELDPRLRAKVNLDVRLAGGRNTPTVQAVYQQRPTPPGGRIFHETTFGEFDPRMQDWRPQDTVLAISLDCAFKGGGDNDFVGLEIWGYNSGRMLCFHSEAERRTFTQTLEHLALVQSIWRAQVIVIEDKANGPAIIDVLTQRCNTSLGARLVEVGPKEGKIARARAASAYFHAGKVFFDKAAPWWERKRDNMLRFPLGHDDDTDAMTQVLLWLASEYGGGEALDAAVSDWQSEYKRLAEMTSPREVWRALYGDTR